MSDLPAPAYANIAMSLSGGGYRAAAFHLGALAYVDRLGLRPSLRRISTVSGGTFTGVAYALALARREGFGAFFRGFYAFLRDANLLKLALQTLVTKPPTNPSHRRDVITSLADVYSTTFLTGEGGRPALLGEILGADHINLDVAAFNATEFRTGIAFRFQRSTIGRAKIGNGYIWIDRRDAARIRLGDIVAASSCFPGGFEPIAFPEDFVWIDGEAPPTLHADGVSPDPGLPLMDGGMYDNEGIGSLVLAEERAPGEPVDLLVISDVGQPSVDMYRMPRRFSVGMLGLGRARLWLINALMVVLAILFVAAAGLLGWHWIDEGGFAIFDIVTFGIPIALCVVAAVFLGRLRWRVGVAIRTIPKLGGHAWEHLKKLTVDNAANMLWLRATSLLKITADVFPRRVRRLVFNSVYENQAFANKRVSNLIESLTTGKWWVMPGIEKPTPALRDHLDRAAIMPTTLWFDDASVELPSLVISGQTSLCYNLLKHLYRHECDRNIDRLSPEKRALWDRLAADWNALRENPRRFLDEMLGAATE